MGTDVAEDVDEEGCKANILSEIPQTSVLILPGRFSVPQFAQLLGLDHSPVLHGSDEHSIGKQHQFALYEISII